MIDRGFIKWKPFDSCFSSQNVVRKIVLEKNKINMPTLSEEQIFNIQENLINSYHLKTIVKIKYYYDGEINYIEGKISYIDLQQKKICIKNKSIYVNQIIQVMY